MTFSCFGKDAQTNEQIFFVLVQNNSTSNMLTHAFLNEIRIIHRFILFNSGSSESCSFREKCDLSAE